MNLLSSSTIIVSFWGLLFSTVSQRVLGDLGEVIMMKPPSFNDSNYTTTYDEGMMRIINELSTLNKTVVEKNLTEWMYLTKQDFRAFDAVILFQPLPVCDSSTSSDRGFFPMDYSPFANSQAWGPALDGNVIISFSREDHNETGMNLRRQGIIFSLAAGSSTTGAYISIGDSYSCQMRDVPLDWLDQAFNMTRNESEEEEDSNSNSNNSTRTTRSGFVVKTQRGGRCSEVIKDTNNPNRLHPFSNDNLTMLETRTFFQSWPTITNGAGSEEDFSEFAGCESTTTSTSSAFPRQASILLKEAPPPPPTSSPLSKRSSKKSKKSKTSKHPKSNKSGY